MKLARVGVLGIALGAGVIAAILALRLTATPSAPPAQVAKPTEVDTVQILVATKDVPMGASLAADAVTWQSWPRASVSEKFVTRAGSADAVEKLAGSVARASFYQGEPINEAKLIRTDSGLMSAILPAGKRAVATKIAADTSAGGFILPNDRVDVIMTRRAEQSANAGGSEFLTETVLNNVRVLAIDQTIEDKGAGEVVVGQTATLELTPQQAQILTVAQQMSDRLTLALRSISDSNPNAADASADAIHLIGGTKRNGAVTVVRNGVARDVSGIR